MDGPFVFFLFDGQERRESDWLKDWENCSSFCRRLRDWLPLLYCLVIFPARGLHGITHEYILNTACITRIIFLHVIDFAQCSGQRAAVLGKSGAGASQENNWLIYIDADWSVSEQQRAPSCLDMSQFLTKVFPMYFLFFFCSSINIGIDEYRFISTKWQQGLSSAIKPKAGQSRRPLPG